jgi:hypothetical protein
MPTTKYEIYVKGTLSFVKFTKQDFDEICSVMDELNVIYTTKIIDLI